MLTLRPPYLCCALGLLVIELYIGLCVHDAFIRPIGGDFLVVILLYCIVRAFSRVPRGYAAGAVLLFAYATEVSQYHHLIQRLGWEQHLWARLLLGTCFSWTDLLAYTAGIASVLVVEQTRHASFRSNPV